MTAKSFGESPEIENLLLVSRNRNWVPMIESLSKEEGNLLVIVGAAHLAGPKSVISLLRKKGFKIRQL